MTYEELKQDVKDYQESLAQETEVLSQCVQDIERNEQRLLDAKLAVLKYEIENKI